MSSGFKKSLIAASISGVLVAPAAYATNGMNVEGYGPIAAAMGGASMAYENGSAATMNNPATLGLMQDGQSRLELALGFLGPDVEATYVAAGMKAKSGGDAYYMPAVGWTKKEGKLSYGVGMFAQGGMGTEYEANTFMAAGTGEAVRSEVGVGRLIAPIAYNLNDKVSIGGSLDFVWAGMDLKMALQGGQFFDFVNPAWDPSGQGGSASGDMLGSLQTFLGGMPTPGTNSNGISCIETANAGICGVRFDFSNTNDFTGEATSTGAGAKLGFVAREGKLTIGGSYHFKTSLSDMETSNATLKMIGDFDSSDGITLDGDAAGGAQANPISSMTITGSVKVKDFQWPATLGLGAAYQFSDKLLLVADVRQIMWSDVMDKFEMTFAANGAVTNGSFANQSMTMELTQNWKDQTAIQLGGAYQMDDALTLRAGMSLSNNPVPDSYMNPLFPAIEKDHITAGLGYKMSDNQGIDFALMHALDVNQTNGGGVNVSHSQMSWQLMYTHNF